MTMTSGVFDVTIDAPVDRVWPWVADLGKHAEWSPKAYTVEWIEGEPNAVGSRYRSVGWVPGDKHHVNEGEIVENRPQERFALRSQDKDGTYDNVFTLEPQGQSTKVTFRLDFVNMKGMARAAVPVLFPIIGKKDLRARMGLLKAKAEASQP
jgi:uncharacterized protein YndB with AHSA1/START domain